MTEPVVGTDLCKFTMAARRKFNVSDYKSVPVCEYDSCKTQKDLKATWVLRTIDNLVICEYCEEKLDNYYISRDPQGKN